ncbi:MAG: BTAD domain-containing putative transcriptional regulator [Pseudomonadota bacterium]
MGSPLQLTLLGSFALANPEGAPLTPPSRRATALIAYLAVKGGAPQPRDELASLLWCEAPQSRAMANLRKTLSRLRAGSLGQCLEANGARIALSAEQVAADVTAFEAAARLATPESLEQAMALYQGEFLIGIADCGEAFEDWLAAERRRLSELAREAMGHLLDHYLATGAIERGIFVALKLLRLDPLDEASHRNLIRLYLYQDRVGAALRQYEQCRDLLQTELGVSPGPETERLRDELLQLLPDQTPRGRETDDLPEKPRVVSLAAATRARLKAELAACPSIAVLPFANRANPDDWGYLCEGLAESLIVELGRFSDLSVIAPPSVFAYNKSAAEAEGIARALGVRYLLVGSLMTRADGLALTVRLVEVASGRQLWAERFEAAPRNIAAVESRILESIVGLLVGRIEAAEQQRIARVLPAHWQAYDLTLQGWRCLRQSGLSTIRDARSLFERALEKDPRYGRAHMGLAMSHLREWACYSWNHWYFPPDQVLQHARDALALDETDHRAHCMLGLVQIFTKDYERAHRHLERALEINPNDADVLANSAIALAILGELERAVALGEKALRLAPHHPEWYASFVAHAYFAARRYEDAIAIASTAPEAICDTPACLAACHAYMGRKQEAALYRDTVYRHYDNQLRRGWFPANTGCIEWLLALNPYRRQEDEDHYVEGLRQAGFS